MSPNDGLFRVHDWTLWRYQYDRYPQHRAELQALWEHMDAYQHFVWARQGKYFVSVWQGNDSHPTFTERPEVPVWISKIIAPAEIAPFWFGEWCDAEFPFECQPRCKPEEVGLLINAELIAREAPPKNWYYAQSGIALGPVSLWWLNQLIAAGRFWPTDLAWHESLSDWIPASQVDDLVFAKENVTRGRFQRRRHAAPWGRRSPRKYMPRRAHRRAVGGLGT